MSRDKDYGKCDSCGEPFEYGMNIVEMRIQLCGQSQGYEEYWQQGATVHLHQFCFKLLSSKELLELPTKPKK